MTTELAQPKELPKKEPRILFKRFARLPLLLKGMLVTGGSIAALMAAMGLERILLPDPNINRDAPPSQLLPENKVEFLPTDSLDREKFNDLIKDLHDHPDHARLVANQLAQGEAKYFNPEKDSAVIVVERLMSTGDNLLEAFTVVEGRALNGYVQGKTDGGNLIEAVPIQKIRVGQDGSLLPIEGYTEVKLMKNEIPLSADSSNSVSIYFLFGENTREINSDFISDIGRLLPKNILDSNKKINVEFMSYYLSGGTKVDGANTQIIFTQKQNVGLPYEFQLTDDAFLKSPSGPSEWLDTFSVQELQRTDHGAGTFIDGDRFSMSVLSEDSALKSKINAAAKIVEFFMGQLEKGQP